MASKVSDSDIASYKKERIEAIKSQYAKYRMTPEQRRAQYYQDEERAIAQMPEPGRTMLAQHLKEIPYFDTEEKDPIVTSNLGLIPPVTFTSETKQHWRDATTLDSGSIVFYRGTFGELDDMETVSDEEFEEEKHTVGVIYTQEGTLFHSGYANDIGVLDDVLVVPEAILKGVKTEAPPGHAFSGRTIYNSQVWSPAPEGKVWFEHPFFPNGADFFDYRLYYFLRRYTRGHSVLGSMPWNRMLEIEANDWHRYGRLEYWCPVHKRFLSEGEMMREEVWFHNGDGSANQRRYYTQNEMLDKYGATDIGVEKGSNDDVIVLDSKSLEQILQERLRKAEESNTVVYID